MDKLIIRNDIDKRENQSEQHPYAFLKRNKTNFKREFAP